MNKSLFFGSLVCCAALVSQPAFAHPDQPAAPMNTPDNRGDAPLAASYAAGYNAPGSIASTNGWDFYADASYILYYANEGGLDLGTLGMFKDDQWEPANENGTVIFQNAKYTSGFKVGIGADLSVDDWVADLEYTYFRQQTTTNSGLASATVTNAGSVAPSIFNVSGWFSTNYFGSTQVADSFQSTWKLHMDLLDLQFSRPFYQGTRLVVAPSVGLRGAWIRQQLSLFSPSTFVYDDFPTPVAATSANYSNSWAVGPRGVVNAKLLVGGGFRFQGGLGASLLYTQYTTVTHTESNLSDEGTLSGGVRTQFKDYNCVRPMSEANLGIGWGNYFSDERYHFDLSVNYDFNYLWSQNMMRYFTSVYSSFSGPGTAGDLYFHGLDVKVRLDF